MTQPHATTSLRAGLDHIDAVDLGDGEYAYYADETSAWYLVSKSHIADLGQALGEGGRDAYSHWCARTTSDEVSDLDHDTLDRIAAATATDIAYRCQCGRATGVRCEWTGDSDALVHLRWVPDSDRGSAQASGTYTYGAYAGSLYVYGDCAEMLRYVYDEEGEPTDREDAFVRVVGPAPMDAASVREVL